MPHKSKISSERKIAIVEGYLRGEMGATQIVKELEITESTLRRWVISYKSIGADMKILTNQTTEVQSTWLKAGIQPLKSVLRLSAIA